MNKSLIHFHIMDRKEPLVFTIKITELVGKNTDSSLFNPLSKALKAL